MTEVVDEQIVIPGLRDNLLALRSTANSFRKAQRSYVPDTINYLILVPTLRCNLSCSYCQVSRVAEKATGFDWSEDTLEAILTFIDQLNPEKLKIEFQGGEPLLALSQLNRVRDHCRSKWSDVEFVVCSNLHFLSDEARDFLSHDDVMISTSFDGTVANHEKQRMSSASEMRQFMSNIHSLLSEFGSEKISLLPTLDPLALPDPVELIDSFLQFGINSIFLRPVANYGFARKAHDAQKVSASWYAFHDKIVSEMVRRNFEDGTRLEDFYLSLCLRRVLRSDTNGHVDLRNPNLLGRDYIVVDYDGTFYPTDEARMLTRTGQVDLSIGHIKDEIDQPKLDLLNSHNSNYGDPNCDICKHQQYCGRDVIDDLSRYGTIDVPRHQTEFCKRHMYMFGLVEKMLVSSDPAVLHSLALWADIPEWDPILSDILR